MFLQLQRKPSTDPEDSLKNPPDGTQDTDGHRQREGEGGENPVGQCEYWVESE
jgi:hypothetical protein